MDVISALMDGELDGPEARRQLGRLKEDAELRERWDHFHLIGDALRGESLLSAGFNENLSKRLLDEPTVLAPRRSKPSARRLTTYALSAAASLCAVVFVAWVALAPSGLITPEPGMAQAPGAGAATAAIEAPPRLASVPSEGRMNEYLLAHQGFSPSTALQGLAPYIRSVTATRPAEGR
jgi:sigma-E factor negative regulatory protein RseA